MPTVLTRRTAATLLAAVCAAVVAAVAGAPPAAAAQPTTPSGALQVYVANVENLPLPDWTVCAHDHRGLLAYLAEQAAAPDVMLLQQLSGLEQAQDLAAEVARRTGHPYAAQVAVADPPPQGTPCEPYKTFQTTGVLYRTDRLEYLDRATQQAHRRHPGETACRAGTQSRTRSLAVRLRDRRTGRTLTAVSVHLPTPGSGGPPCAERNVRRLDRLARTWPSSVVVVGGDHNVPDLARPSAGSGYRSWYRLANGALGGSLRYADAVHRLCDARTSTATGLKRCLLGAWTFRHASGSRERLDFLFGRRGSGPARFTDQHTVTFSEAGTYSDHRAVRARVHWD